MLKYIYQVQKVHKIFSNSVRQIMTYFFLGQIINVVAHDLSVDEAANYVRELRQVRDVHYHS